jgi:hypothetical protein
MPREHAEVADKNQTAQPCSSNPTEHAQDVEDELAVVAGTFPFLYNEYKIAVDELGATIAATDPVGWAPTLAEALLDFALGKATEKIAALFADRVLQIYSGMTHDRSPSPLGALQTRHAQAISTVSLPPPTGAFDPKPFIAGMFAKGVTTGSIAGKQKLRESSNSPPLARFLAANLEAANLATSDDQAEFLTTGRHQIKTKREATALRDAFSKDALKAAGRKHQEQTRDAWVSYVAQQKFGEGADGLTDMRAQQQRDFSNKPINREGPAAPDPVDGLRGKNDGVLEVWAELPSTNGMWMNGEPRVKAAVLSGVNSLIRAQYEHHKLSECRIPRQVTGTVKGGHEDFVINLDEEGLVSRLSRQQSGWLRDRATVNHPENLAKDDSEKADAGLKLLLEDLVLTKIVSKVW